MSTLVALILIVLFAACTASSEPITPQPPTAESTPLAGTEWILASLNGQPPLPDNQITINFDANRSNGFAGCNRYGGEYMAEGNSLTFAEMARTVMDCPEPVGVLAQEAAYLDALQRAVTYQVINGRLEIYDSAGEILLAFTIWEEVALDPAALVGTQWQLVSLNGDQTVAGSRYTLKFLDTQWVIGRAGCRAHVFSYEAEGDDIRFPMQAMFGKGCLDEAIDWQQEGQYTDSFSWATHYRLDENQFELLTPRGEVLRFTPLPQETSLEQTEWQLVALATKLESGLWTEMYRPLEATTITAVFADNKVSGSAGCNGYYQLEGYPGAGERLTIGPLGREKKFCQEPEGVMEQEARYLEFLQDVTIAHLAGDLLWLETGDGRALLFDARVP